MDENKLIMEDSLDSVATKQSKIENATKNNAIDSFNYTGIVTVKLQQGNKIISNKTYHNNGTQKLFKFICGCLGGLFTSGSYEATKPCRLSLFTGKDSDPLVDSADKKDFWDTNKLNAPIYLSSTPVTSKVYKQDTQGKQVEDTKAYSITYNFKIPFALLKASENGTTYIYKAALYNNTSFDYDNRYAYYRFTKTADNTEEWAPISINLSNKSASNFSIIVEWKMIFKNN